MKNVKDITTYLEKVIIGQILADGYVEKTGINCRLSFSFGTNYKEYADWIWHLLKDYCSNSVYPVVSVAKDKKYTNYRLKTKTSSIFNKYRTMFYILQYNGKHKKIVPSAISDIICPIVLAHLIIGDGTFSTSDNRIRICTYNFTFNECVILSNAITNNCGIVCKVMFDRIGSSGDKQYVLTIGKNQLIKTQKVVFPHIHTSMLYRIGIIPISPIFYYY